MAMNNEHGETVNLDFLHGGQEDLPVEIRAVQIRNALAVGDTARAISLASLCDAPASLVVGGVARPEVIKNALEAAVMGHRVFAEVHANSAADVPLRLDLMMPAGAQREYLAALRADYCTAIIGQRLVRELCSACARPDDEAKGMKRRGSGCPTCGGLGVIRRRAVFEVLEITPEVRGAIRANQLRERFVALLHEQGGRTINEQIEELSVEGKVDRDTFRTTI